MIDEEDDKLYESFEDGKIDVRHLKWPLIIMIIVIIALIILSDIYIPE